jgi:glycosyltransferase involved in cell wall biosynthesis
MLDTLGPGWVAGVMCLQDGPAVAALRAAGNPVQIIETGARAGLLSGALRLRRALRADPPQVVHANGVKAALVAALGLLATGIPVLWVKHDFSWDGPLVRAIAMGCAEVVGVSEAVLAALRGRRLPRRLSPRTTVIPNGIPDPDPGVGSRRTVVRAQHDIPDGAPLVVLLGRLHPAKGQLELLEAAPVLLARCPTAHFVLAGAEDPAQPEYARRVRARIAELGLGDRTRLTGHLPAAAELIAAADAVVIPSVPDDQGMGREGFGLVGIEALALGAPVVGYADGALPEVLGDCAVLVAPGDRRALGSAIADVITDRPWRDTMTERGHARFAARYRIEATAGAMAIRYRALAGSR